MCQVARILTLHNLSVSRAVAAATATDSLSSMPSLSSAHRSRSLFSELSANPSYLRRVSSFVIAPLRQPPRCRSRVRRRTGDPAAATAYYWAGNAKFCIFDFVTTSPFLSFTLTFFTTPYRFDTCVTISWILSQLLHTEVQRPALLPHRRFEKGQHPTRRNSPARTPRAASPCSAAAVPD